MTNFLTGLALGGYRSFGRNVQRIGPFTKVNFLAGLNNSGKSNFLRFIERYLPYLYGAETTKGAFDPTVHKHIGATSTSFTAGIVYPLDSTFVEELIERLVGNEKVWMRDIMRCDTFTAGTDCIWFCRTATAPGAKLTDEDRVSSLATLTQFTERQWQLIWHRLHPTKMGGSVKAWIGEILLQMTPFKGQFSTAVAIVPAIRRIGEPTTKPGDYSGLGIIDRLAQLQNPSHHQQEKKQQFDRIVNFLREVIGNHTASLEIPYERDQILVHMDGKTLPLLSLGTGIHEVVILASAATVLENQILCVEEPELHLHPLLQRKLVQYLADKTSNQYFISTHSAHLLDSSRATTFHVTMSDGETNVVRASTSMDRWEVCRDLGYRASDIFQSNCVIWVEGPSDRVYINHWLASVAPDLIESVHYSLMFYGGRLLCHLAADDPEVTDFISLRRINRNLAIIIDSDRATSAARLNATKERIVQEIGQCPGLAWVTAGREIENYVDPNVLHTCVDAIKPGLGVQVRPGRYARSLPTVAKTSRTLVDKLKVAHEVSSYPANLARYDLRERIDALIEFIRRANS